jgi:hypothetical protein
MAIHTRQHDVTALDIGWPNISAEIAPVAAHGRPKTEPLGVPGGHIHLPRPANILNSRADDAAEVRVFHPIVVDHCNPTDAQVRELDEGYGPGSAQTDDHHVEVAKDFLACLPQGQTLSIKPIRTGFGEGLVWRNSKSTSDDPHLKLRVLCVFQPYTSSRNTRLAGNHH